jgi:hypothetical protein
VFERRAFGKQTQGGRKIGVLKCLQGGRAGPLAILWGGDTLLATGRGGTHGVPPNTPTETQTHGAARAASSASALDRRCWKTDTLRAGVAGGHLFGPHGVLAVHAHADGFCARGVEKNLVHGGAHERTAAAPLQRRHLYRDEKSCES